MKQPLPSVRNRAFTLVELLTVIAITAILMTIIVVPMIQSFNTVRGAEAFSNAQERARILLETISREISNGAGVRDNAGDLGACDIVVPGGVLPGLVPPDPRTPPTPGGPPVTVRLRYTKLDIVKPAQEGPVDASGYFINRGGKIDPTMHAPKGQIVLPVAPGPTIVRYWIGLRDPFSPYNNPYDGLLMARGGGRDNLYVLLRAEVQPMVNVGGVLKPNTAFFAVDGSGNLVEDDPGFYLWDGSDPTKAGTKGNRVRNWLNKATVVTEVSRYDMISPILDPFYSRSVLYDPDPADPTHKGIPRILPLIQFAPTRVGSEPANGMEPVRLSNESEGMDQFASDVFKTKLGGWSNTVLRLYESGWSGGAPYEVARSGGTTDVSVFYFDPSLGGDELSTGVESFDISRYENEVAQGGFYPFSDAVVALGLSSVAEQNAFAPFWTDAKLGKVVASFGIWEVGAAGGPVTNNLPSKSCGTQQVPGSSPAPVLPGNFSNYANSINDQFTRVWLDYQVLRPNIQRFIDLRVTPQADGTPSPLYLNLGTPTGFPRATIVPGSEVVTGPDQRPGNYGNANLPAVRYTRTTGSPGVNQYRINYVNLPEPTNSAGLIDYSLLGVPNPPAPYNPASPPPYDPTNFVLAVIQPRYKVGYIQLNSDPTIALPAGKVTVQYRFQFTKPGDSLTVDYDSRQVISLLLTIKNYAQTSDLNPQAITLKASATVRNFQR